MRLAWSIIQLHPKQQYRLVLQCHYRQKTRRTQLGQIWEMSIPTIWPEQRKGREGVPEQFAALVGDEFPNGCFRSSRSANTLKRVALSSPRIDIACLT